MHDDTQTTSIIINLEKSTVRLEENVRMLTDWQRAQDTSIQSIRADIKQLQQEVSTKLSEGNQKLDRLIFWIMAGMASAILSFFSQFMTSN